MGTFGTDKDLLQDIYDCEFTVKKYTGMLPDPELACSPYVKPQSPVPLGVAWAIWVDRNRPAIVDLSDFDRFDATIELLRRRGWVKRTEGDWRQAMRSMTQVRLNQPDGFLGYPLRSGGMCVIRSGFNRTVGIPPANTRPPDVDFADLLPYWQPHPHLGVQVVAPSGTPPSLADSFRYSAEGRCAYIAITAKGIARLEQDDRDAADDRARLIIDPPATDGPRSPNLLDDTPANREEAVKMPKREREVLAILCQHKAFDEVRRKTTQEIAQAASGTSQSNYKEPVSALKKKRFVETAPGRGGGVWLTAEGKDLARAFRAAIDKSDL